MLLDKNISVRELIMDDSQEIQAHIAEYTKLRDELLQVLNHQHQTIAWVLGSVSIAVPLLLGQTTNIAPIFIVVILYFLTIIYSIIAINFINNLFNIGAISRYLNDYIGPVANLLLRTKPNQKVLNWEMFIKQERSRVIPALLSSAGGMANSILMFMPGSISLATSQIVLSLPNSALPMSGLLIGLLNLLSVVAWASYVISIMLLLFATFYRLFAARWFYLPKKKKKFSKRFVKKQ